MTWLLQVNSYPEQSDSRGSLTATNKQLYDISQCESTARSWTQNATEDAIFTGHVFFWGSRDLCMSQVWAASIARFILNNTCTTYSILAELLTQPFQYLMSPPPHLHYAQLYGSAHSPAKCPASSLLSLMISPEFIVPESCNRLMKLRENNWGSWDVASSLSHTLQWPNPCKIRAWMRQP